MESRYIRTLFQQMWNRKVTPLIVSALFMAAIAAIAHLSMVVTDLTADKEKLSVELRETRPFIKLSEDQASYISELEKKVDFLEESTAKLEGNLSSLESELAKLETNLNILGDIKDKTE
jgi:predicted nuclease with TOPRIM domain